MKIVIADDDQVFVKILTAAFRTRGWQVVQAFDAMQAVMFAGRSPRPDLVVLDLGMPGGSGFSVLERLGRSAATASIPVLVVTANEDDDAEERVLGRGAVGFHRKPVDPVAIVEAASAATGLAEQESK